MTKRNIVHIEIPTADAKKSGEFYKEMFGWKITTDEKMNYTMWKPGEGVMGGFSPVGMGGVKPGDTLIYIDSDDIEADLKKIVKLGGKVVRQKEEIPGIGWWAIFLDPTGNQIALYTANPAYMRPQR